MREHLGAAGRELCLALGAGLSALHGQAKQTGMTARFPYLDSALDNLTTALTGFGHLCAVATTTPTTARKKTPAARRRTTSKGASTSHDTENTGRGTHHE